MAFNAIKRAVCFGFLAVAAVHGAVENLACEQIDATTYELSFEFTEGSSEMLIFASESPNRITNKRPIARVRQSSARVTVSALAGRVYFHVRPDRGATRVVSVRRLPLRGAENFRDLGGYKTSDGRTVRWGQVYRSGQLSALTDDDYRYLSALGIRSICDFRLDEERSYAPTRWLSAIPPLILTLPITAGQSEFMRLKRAIPTLTGREILAGFRDIYIQLPNATEQYRVAFDRILNASGATLVHCSAGKDRTGMFAAILLSALGVPRSIILADYLLTNKYLLQASAVEDAQRRLHVRGMGVDVVVTEALLGVRPEFLEAAFQTIDNRYGSFLHYWRKLGLSDKDLQRLRAILLVP